MSIDINVEGLCPKCKADHEAEEQLRGEKFSVQEAEMCKECKIKYGFKQPRGEYDMKKGKRKYTRRTEVRADKPVKLDKDTKRFIKNILKSEKKADRLDAKAEKFEDKAAKQLSRAGDMRLEATTLRAGMAALKDAVAGL